MRSTTTLSLALAAAISCGWAQTAVGANCALRNPERQIRDIFGPDTEFRTETGAIDDALRLTIEQRLGSSLSRTDIGKHTAYVVLRNGVPMGFVHARTETGSRGSVELVWAMDLDLTIKDFRVQRSREPHSKIIESESFRQKMVGRDLTDLRNLLTKGNTDVNLLALGVPETGRAITRAVVVCGLKTRVITEMAFTGSVGRARLLGHTYRCFPETTVVKKVVRPYGDAARLGEIIEIMGSTADQIDGPGFTMLRALGESDRVQGALVKVVWAGHDERPETWWAVSAGGVIEQAWVVADHRDRVLDTEFTALRGADLGTLLERGGADDAGAAGCAVEVLAVLAANGIGRAPGP